MKHRTTFVLGLVAALAVAAGMTTPSAQQTGLMPGAVALQSAGPLAFGPDGVLFVADSVGAAIVAIDTGDRQMASGSASINVEGLDARIAALVGTTPDQIMVADLKVNPASKNVYVSASRGRGPDAMPLIVRVDTAGEISVVSLDDVMHASFSLSDAPAADPNARRDPRMQTITDMVYVDGRVMVAGLSNEEWSSAMRSVPYPFERAEETATVQIWHASHGRYETEAPVRTFVPYSIAGEEYVLAAYTCTPLVKIPVSSLQAGAMVEGVTIADLGAGNQPLDMVPYVKDGRQYILVANSSRGVMKLMADNLEAYEPIDAPTVVDVAGVPYETISELRDVTQLAHLDDDNALILAGSDLRTIALP